MSTPDERPAIPQEVKDAAQRMADAVNLHVHAVLAEGTGRDRPGYVAIRLEDGRSPDGILYDTRYEACYRHRFNPAVCYIAVGRDTMPLNQAILQLQNYRQAYYRSGYNFSEVEVVTPHLPELLQPFIPNTLRGIRNG